MFKSSNDAYMRTSKIFYWKQYDKNTWSCNYIVWWNKLKISWKRFIIIFLKYWVVISSSHLSVSKIKWLILCTKILKKNLSWTRKRIGQFCSWPYWFFLVGREVFSLRKQSCLCTVLTDLNHTSCDEPHKSRFFRPNHFPNQKYIAKNVMYSNRILLQWELNLEPQPCGSHALFSELLRSRLLGIFRSFG